MKAAFKYQLLTFLWTFFILVMCSISLGKIGQSHLFFAGFDKLVHCGLFFVLAVLMCNGSIRQHGRSYLSFARCFIVILICIAFGGAIELLQKYFFTWRSGEWGDLFADTVGICMAIFSILIALFAADDQKN